LIFNFPLLNNEPFFAVRALEITKGNVLHTGNLFNNHGPLSVYFLSFVSIFSELNWSSIHLAGFFWDLLILITLFFISRKYLGLENAIISSAIYLVLSVAFYGTIYNSEYPCAFFGLLGFLAYIKFLEKNKSNYLFLAGFLIAISLWFKQTGFFFFLAIFFNELYLNFKRENSFRKLIKNNLIIISGILIFSLPLLTYFFYYTQWKFLEDMIIFNLLFETRHSRIIVLGKFIRMLAFYFGFLFVLILAKPKRTESENEIKKEPKIIHKITRLFMIYSIIMILFFAINRELFGTHLMQLAVVLIPLSMIYYSKYKDNSLKIIRILLIISLLSIFMVSLEEIAREHLNDEKIEQEQIQSFMKKEIPRGSLVYSVFDLYPFLGGYQNPYRWTTLQPNVESIDPMDDFCNFLDNVDYIIFTGHQKKYLGKKNLNCAYSKFTIIKEFEDIGQSNVEILKKSS